VENVDVYMAHFLNTTHFCDTDVDNIIGDLDLLRDVADSSLWDIPASVGECGDVDVRLDVAADDSVIADIHKETNEYPERYKVSDNTMTKSAGLRLKNRGASVSNGLRQHMSKNAILARENREKKKRYICGLEKTVHDLSVKNKKLVQGCAAMHSTIADLRREVNYLRGVIENQSELARLLKRIPAADQTCPLEVDLNRSLFDASSCNGQPLPSSSLDSSELIHTESVPTADCESLLIEHDYARSQRQNNWNNSSRRQFGVCLHVANQVTSLQLCASCNENAL